MSLASLPTELYSVIMDQLPPESLHHSLLQLTRALPSAPISLHPLFQCITLRRPEQATSLIRRLIKPDGAEVSLYVQELSLHDVWTVDADVMVNVLRKLRKLSSLSLCVGTNFAPEHLKAILEIPRPDLRYLSLRFRPYVQRATYQQFLSGSYFDSTLACLADWPESDFRTLSIVQEPMDPAQAPKVAFAQPIVFFRLDSNLSALAQSPYLKNLTSLRLRIPSRPVANALTMAPFSLPAVELLDLSTCNVFGSELTDVILARLPKLKYLILDNGALLRGEYHAEDWAVMGKGCALAGLKRTKEREKILRQARLETAPAAAREKRPHRGRKGVSTATVSLRASSPPDAHVVSVKDTPRAHALHKIRLYPASPSLRLFATTLPPSVPPEKHDEIREEFERGWSEGLAQLIEVRARLYQSYRLGSTIMRFANLDEDEGGDETEGLEGLVEVSNWDDDVEMLTAPSLCLVGPGKSEAHVVGCAHSIAWTVWKDL